MIVPDIGLWILTLTRCPRENLFADVAAPHLLPRDGSYAIDHENGRSQYREFSPLTSPSPSVLSEFWHARMTMLMVNDGW
jgi:hypothetical protein